MASSNFKITQGKGVHLTFENGWAVSVQWGPGNYCDNHGSLSFKPVDVRRVGEIGSDTAECAVFNSAGAFVDLPDTDDQVTNRSTPAEVLALLNWAASQQDAPE